MTTKTYANKSNAKRAATAAGLDMSTAVLVEVDGKFAYQAPSVVNEMDEQFVSVHGFCECPRCNVHLSNGVMDFNSLAEDRGYAEAYSMQAKMYACMGCDYEWGTDIAEPGAAKARSVSTGTGIKIQKVRVEANGITRPSVGGVCDAVWNKCDALSANGMVPPVKDIKAWALEAGVDNTTATIQYYAWRKHMGVVGRAKEMPAK